jgi:hypothetical protein
VPPALPSLPISASTCVAPIGVSRPGESRRRIRSEAQGGESRAEALPHELPKDCTVFHFSKGLRPDCVRRCGNVPA